MGRGKALTDYEKGLIDGHQATCDDPAVIATLIGRSRKGVTCYLEDPKGYGTRKSPGRPSKLTVRDKRRLYRAAAPGELSSAQLAAKLDFKVSKRTGQHALVSSEIFAYVKMNAEPKLRPYYKVARLEWAKRHHYAGDDH